MARVDLIMPKMGESIMEATILKWNKKVGDTIAMDESVLDIATDKVDSEVPSPTAGTLVEMLHAEGAVVPVGGVLAIIETSGGAATSAASPTVIATAPENVPSAASQVVETPVPYIPQPQAISTIQTDRFYSPLVLNIAQSEGINMSELALLPGSGNEGRVTKKDILAYVAQKKNGSTAPVSQTPIATPQATVAPSTPATTIDAPKNNVQLITDSNIEIVEMDRMRKIIAENMVQAKRIAAHVTSFVEADLTSVVLWREKVKKAFEKRENEKLTFTPLFMEAIIKALKDFPMMNVSVDGDKILVKKDINLGMAAAMPNGNLIVPVIKNADRLNLVGLTKAVNDLANRARTNKLKPDEIQGGTYTLSNVGSFGNVMGTPIIPQPQVGILAVGAIRKKPAVIETPQGDFIGIRHMMFLSHSYDHRVVDGALGGMFVRRVADYLENWDINREI